ncbi:DUF4124 domain-containing protein [Methylonatrum kenyense]|uniref:DUF4124 domain-containing protein n=1 Tax=Methylonatrum kenyense TaxID=455253 RepID=UPI0020C18472|nr:DUF4124 domain-containing protein [Methylonatrum kenyense]MCK8515886.1 DUF4124 domain-containing protein [Methylonatrum kenyense]
MTIRILLALLTSGLLLQVSLAMATTVYIWTDDRGNRHYSDERPPDGVSFRTLEVPGSAVSRSAAPSERVREIRCRDFQGALEQLLELDDIDGNEQDWRAAKQVARDGISEWCRS